MRRRPIRPLALLLPVLAILAGCGSSAAPHRAAARRARPSAARRARPTASRPDPICMPGAREALAARYRVSQASIAVRQSIGSNDSPQCTFTVPRRHGRPLSVRANVYSGPQPYFILDRQEEEMSQMFGPARTQPAPTTVLHLGLEAYWFPELEQLGASDGIHLVTTQVLKPPMSMRRQLAIDIVVTRPYLTAHISPNSPLITGAPAGAVSGKATSTSGSGTAGSG